MCKGFGSTLTGPALQLYINLPSRSIASYDILSVKFVEKFASSRGLEKTPNSLYEILQHRAEPLRSYIARFNQEKVAIPECSIPTAISAFKRGLLLDGDLYMELNKDQCKKMEDVLSRAWAHVKWEEDVASRAKAQLKQDPKTVRPDRIERDEKPSPRPAKDSGNRNRDRYQNRPIEKAEGMAVSTWPDISHLSVSRPELIDVLRQIGQQVKWPQKMKAPYSFRNPGLWSDFHCDRGHKTEDCVALKIEVKKLLKKGHLREFLSEKAKSNLSKETTGKPTEAAPVSPPRQDRVIHVISGGSEISGVRHAAAKYQSLILGRNGAVPGTEPGMFPSRDPGCLLAGTQKPVSCLGFRGIQYLSRGLAPSSRTADFLLKMEKLGAFSGASEMAEPGALRNGAVPGTEPGMFPSRDPGCLLAGTQKPVSCLGFRGIQYLSRGLAPSSRTADFLLKMEKLGAFSGASEMAEPGALVDFSFKGYVSFLSFCETSLFREDFPFSCEDRVSSFNAGSLCQGFSGIFGNILVFFSGSTRRGDPDVYKGPMYLLIGLNPIPELTYVSVLARGWPSKATSQHHSCFFDDGPRSEIREGDLADMRRKYAIHPSVGMRSPSEFERAPDG
ncbi:hypothetical protein F2Q70_00017768 [Brassica cretica]|uniref:Retrotransposon gag domain-containing protein n=1 Tax=Brassica cretica TaxID=69181 RepID=A0A8S9HUM4_BRACR|nr:hypothetical protein F2Q70_00017768 [Brassica cretica]